MESPVPAAWNPLCDLFQRLLEGIPLDDLPTPTPQYRVEEIYRHPYCFIPITSPPDITWDRTACELVTDWIKAHFHDSDRLCEFLDSNGHSFLVRTDELSFFTKRSSELIPQPHDFVVFVGEGDRQTA